MPTLELFSTLVIFFTPCEMAGRISIGFDEINDHINQFDWYLFSLEMKKLLLIVMANGQQPVDIACFGSFACNRSTFKKVKRHEILVSRFFVNLWLRFFPGHHMCIFVFHGAATIWMKCKTNTFVCIPFSILNILFILPHPLFYPH